MGKRITFAWIRLLPAVLILLSAVPSLASDPMDIPARKPPVEVERLIDVLRRGNSTARYEAAVSLGEAGDPRAVNPLVVALGDPMDDVRDAAAGALKKMGEPLGELIHACLAGSGKDWERKAGKAKEELARRKDPRAVLPLVMALGAWNVSVRVAAARTLMVLEDPATVGPLIEAMGSEYKPVREAAAWALVKIGDSRAFDPMIKALEDGYDPVRVAAAYALGGLGDPRAVDPLIGALGDWHYGVRRGAAWSLGRIGGGRTVEPLTRALRDSHEDVREAAAWSLAQTGDRRVVGTFVEALFDASPKVRRIAITVLGELGGRKAIDPLISAVGDDEPNVGMAAAQALERFGEPLGKEIFAVLSGDRKARMELARKKDPRTLDPLIRSLRNPNGKVRRAAARALGDIGDPRAIDGLIVLAGGWNLPDRAVALSALMRLKQKGSDRLGLLLRVVNYPSSRAFLIVLAVVAIIVFSWKRQISKINRRAARHASRSAVTSAGQPDPSRRL